MPTTAWARKQSSPLVTGATVISLLVIVITAAILSLVYFLRTGNDEKKRESEDPDLTTNLPLHYTTTTSQGSSLGGFSQSTFVTTEVSELTTSTANEAYGTSEPDLYTDVYNCKMAEYKYFGSISVTASGDPCLRWEEILQYESLLYLAHLENFPEQSWSSLANKCRNPDNDYNGPWCFTLMDGDLGFDYCNISDCPEDLHIGCLSNPCLNGGTCVEDGEELVCVCPPDFMGFQCEGSSVCRRPSEQYEGTHAVSVMGVPCMHWSDAILLISNQDMDAWLAEEVLQNFCRQIEYEGGANILCFTLINKQPRNDACSIANCRDEADCESSIHPYSGNANTVEHITTELYRAHSNGAETRTLPCSRWSVFEQTIYDNPIHGALMQAQLYPDATWVAMENKCRNPMHASDGPGCIVYNELSDVNEYQACGVSRCTGEQCTESTCQNNGTCVDSRNGTEGTGGLSCLCTERFTGRYCEIAAPCVAGGQVYSGNLSVSASGKACVRWDLLYGLAEQAYPMTLGDFPESSWQDLHAQCRAIPSQYLYSPRCFVFSGTFFLDLEGCSINTCAESRYTCKKPLISPARHRIHASRLTASSSLDASSSPARSRLDSQASSGLSGAWRAGDDEQQPWIQVDLGSARIIEGVVTQGRADEEEWVTEYSIAHGFTADSLTWLETDGATHVFSANNDRNTHVQHVFERGHVIVRHVRLQVRAWHGAASLRWELLGCESMTSTEAFQSSTQSPHRAGRAINGDTEQNLTLGSCSMTRQEIFPWWSVDLGSERMIFGVVIFNRADCCGENLRDFWMYALNDTPNPRDSVQKESLMYRTLSVTASEQGYAMDFLDPKRGRYFSIEPRGNLFETPLVLCEVMVKSSDVFPIECVREGYLYNGDVATSSLGNECNTWQGIDEINGVTDVLAANPFIFNLDNFPDTSWDELDNKCRNPTRDVRGPFCFVRYVDGDYMSVEQEFCSIPTCTVHNPCLPNPCLNDGLCLEERGGAFSCDCAHGYRGRFCESGDCIESGSAYTGSLAVSADGRACLEWSVYQLFEPSFTLDHLPDTSWDEAANKCRVLGQGPICLAFDNERIIIASCYIPACTGDEDETTPYDENIVFTTTPLITDPATDPPAMECYYMTGPYEGRYSLPECLDWHDAQLMLLYGVTLFDLSFFPDDTWQALGSKCRNPSLDPSGPWCITHRRDGVSSYASCGMQLCDDADDCTPNPCLHGGTCVDGVHSYTCTCAQGYSGVLCESGDCRDSWGAAYAGDLAISRGGRRCLRWDLLNIYATAHIDVTFELEEFPDSSWEELGNKCRLLRQQTRAPICFILTETGRADSEFCNVPVCGEVGSSECIKPNGLFEYRGEKNTTTGGHTCLLWRDLTDLFPGMHLSQFPDATWEEVGNKCRNPTDGAEPWCVYWDDEQYMVDLCGIPHCSDVNADDCEPDPCMNGATCTDGVDSFTCTCAHGFVGLLCESGDCREPDVEYAGSLAISTSGRRCLRWQAVTDLQLEDFPDASWEQVANHCRNPHGVEEGPYCFVFFENVFTAEFCNLPLCQ